MLSLEEYEALPPLIQKKCFSTEERLEITKQASSQKRKRQATKGTWLAPPSPSCLPRPSTSAGVHSASSQVQANEPEPLLFNADQEAISQEQATWFLTLPDKVRKQIYSREEQVALMVRCQKVFQHLSPASARVADAQSSYFPEQRPSTSNTSGSDASKSFLSIDSSPDVRNPNINQNTGTVESYTPPPVRKSAEQVAIPPPPTPPSEPKSLASIGRPKRKSLHRRMSLIPLALPAPKLAPAVPSVPALPSVDPMHRSTRSAGLRRPSVEQLITTPEPPVTRKHYQDPDARLQLRNALSSPENFDEALAFGFFSTDRSLLPTSQIEQCFPIQQLPLYDSEYEDDDNHSVETLGPRTPTPYSANEAAIKQPSFGPGVDFPMHQTSRPTTSTSCSPTGSVGNREMTIHMTLTRKELRRPAEELYSVQPQQTSSVAVEEHDPLALERLPVCDDPTGAHGAFAVHGSVSPKGLKRVWKTLTRH